MVFLFLILKRVDWTVLVQVFFFCPNSLFSCKIVNMICGWWIYVLISNIAICRLQSRLSNFRALLYSPEELSMGSAQSYSTYQWVSSLVEYCWCVIPLWHTHITPTLASTCQSSVFEHFVWTIHNESTSTSDIIVTRCYASQFETRRTDWQPETERWETLVSITLNPPCCICLCSSCDHCIQRAAVQKLRSQGRRGDNKHCKCLPPTQIFRVISCLKGIPSISAIQWEVLWGFKDS